MWPRRCVDFYVHEEFEMLEEFSSGITMGDAYRQVPREASLSKFLEYVNNLARYPDIVMRVSNRTGLRWFVIPVRNNQDLISMVSQIE